MNIAAFRPPELEQTAGRLCPTDYVYAPSVFARAADLIAETLYVAGGLYGNLAALTAIKALAAAEPRRAEIVFNGDFHWFDITPDWFAAIEHGVRPHRALRGNVETEIARGNDIGAGCGCAYPETVDDGTVRRSNLILSRLRAIMPAATRKQLAASPTHLVAQVGGLRIGVVHGDAASLAGWRFAPDALDDSLHRIWLNEIRAASGIDVFASTHTCLAALRHFPLAAGPLTVANNGAAGMPNFSGSRFGILTRIATTPSPHRPLYGLDCDGVHVDAIAVDYDYAAFLNLFLKHWPPGSPAYRSYYRRIVDGPAYDLGQAAP